jgi:hypothetical protein
MHKPAATRAVLEGLLLVLAVAIATSCAVMLAGALSEESGVGP